MVHDISASKMKNKLDDSFAQPSHQITERSDSRGLNLRWIEPPHPGDTHLCKTTHITKYMYTNTYRKWQISGCGDFQSFLFYLILKTRTELKGLLAGGGAVHGAACAIHDVSRQPGAESLRSLLKVLNGNSDIK